MIIRPVTLNDHESLSMLAEKAGHGMTSLPQDAGILESKIITSQLSFANKPSRENEHRFLFVMEDEMTGEIVGSTGVKAHIGLSDPFYSYKLSTIVQASAEPKRYCQNRVLHMVNDYTGASEIGSLFLRESYRRDGLGRCLSRCRFLLMAQFPELFDDLVIAEMRGVHNEEAYSPFYANLAKHFFQMPFREADYINATKGGQFIADLMPKYPIYVNLLAPEAQEVIGEVNEASKPALKLLEREGFRYAGYLDIFDAGPTVVSQRKRIRTVEQSRNVTISKLNDSKADTTKFIVMTTELKSVRVILAKLALNQADGTVEISKADADKLNVSQGETLRIVEA